MALETGVQVFRTSDGEHVSSCVDTLGGAIWDLAFIGDTRNLVTVSSTGHATLWDATTGRRVSSLEGHDGHAIESLDVSVDGRRIATSSYDQWMTIVWDAESGEAIRFHTWRGEERPQTVCFDPSGERLLLTVSHGPTKVLAAGEWEGDRLPWRVPPGLRNRRPLPYLVSEATFADEWGRVARFSPDGERVAIVYQNALEPTIWDVSTGNKVATLPYPDQITYLAQFSPDGKYLLTGTGRHPNLIADPESLDAQVVVIWRAEDGEILFFLHGQTGTVTSAEFFASGHRVMTASLDGTVLLWDIDIPDTALLASCFAGKTEKARQWLDAGAAADAQFGTVTAAHAAAIDAHTETLEMLFDRGVPVDVTEAAFGGTPLHVAATNNQAGLVPWLVSRGADPNARAVGDAPLHLAARNGHTAVAEALLEAGADIDAKNTAGLTPLGDAVAKGHREVAKRLIARGADVHVRGNEGESVLYRAVYGGDVAIVRALLALQVDVDAKRDGGHFPLAVAAEMGFLEVVDNLIAAGADPAANTDLGSTALHQAARGGHTSVVSRLLEIGLDIEAPTVEAETPLHLAARAGHVDTTTFLLDRGASPDAQDEHGGSALFYAAMDGRERLVRVLVAGGADPELALHAGAFALYMAAQNGHDKVIDSLASAGASVNRSLKGGLTPLMVASAQGHLLAVRLLLHHGAEPGSRSEEGHTSADYAEDPRIRKALANAMGGQGD